MPLNDALTNLANAVRNVTANEHKLSIADMSKQLTDFNFIRPNLLEHTKSWYGGTDYWGPTFSRYRIESEQKDPYGNNVISCTSSWADAAHKMTIDPGTYTFSCWIKLAPDWNDKSNLHCYTAVDQGITDWYGVVEGLAKDKWIHYVKTFQVYKSPVMIRIESDGTDRYYLGSYKLEKGNKFTGYTNLTQVGGVVKALLSALLPVRGCFV